MTTTPSALEFLSFTAESLLALIESSDRFESLCGVPPADGLREFFVSDDVAPEFLEMLQQSAGSDNWRFGFAVVDRPSNRVIGSAGFKGPPDEAGVVEIAYGITAPFQGRGHATAVAAWLVNFARCDVRVRQIIAHTLPEKNASTRVLEKNRFEFARSVEDPDDGTIWRWELPVARDSG